MIKSISTATAQPAFNVTKFRKLPIPIPPLEDQHRIVTRIEELFSQLDSGVETLKKTKEQLKVYRQAVLKEAFEGNWKIFKAKDLCFFITKGTTPKKTELRTTGDIPFIKVYNLTFDTSLDFSIEPTFVSKGIHSGFLARSIVYPDIMSELNIIHPFREGNGRSIRELIRYMALHYGFTLDWSCVEREQLKQRQREDIEIAKAQGKYTGRKPIPTDLTRFGQLYGEWKSKSITGRDFMRRMACRLTPFTTVSVSMKRNTASPSRPLLDSSSDERKTPQRRPSLRSGN